MALQVLAELKAIFKADAGLELNVSKTSILPKGTTAQVVFDMAQTIMQATPTLAHPSNDVLLDSFCPEAFIGIGVPIDTDVCQATRLQYINLHIMFPNHCVLQQQHADCKIADTLLKKGTKQHADGWNSSSKDWTHMCIHLPHAEGGFGVTSNDVTKDAAFYTTTSRFVAWLGAFPQERQKLWLPQVNVGTGVGPSSQSQVNIGSGPRPSSQDGVSQIQDPVPLSLPQLNRLVETSFVRDERSASNTDVTVIPSQIRVTQHIGKKLYLAPGS